MVKSGRATKTAPPGRLLTQVAGERQTGALIVGGHPGGTLLPRRRAGDVRRVAGRTRCRRAADRLRAARRRAPGRPPWTPGPSTGPGRRAARRAGPSHPGRAGVVRARRDLRRRVLRAARPRRHRCEFVAGATHWLGPVIRVDAAAVGREARRRVRLLDEIFPHPRDRHRAGHTGAPAAPSNGSRSPRRSGSCWCTRTASAPRPTWPSCSDGPVTPPSRSCAGSAGQGLLELPGAAQRDGDRPDFVRLPRGRGPYVGIERPTVTATAATPVPPDVPIVPGNAGRTGTARRPTPGTTSGDRPKEPAPAQTPSGSGTDRPPRLPRRKPNARLPEGCRTRRREHPRAPRCRRSPAQADPYGVAGTAVTRAPPTETVLTTASRQLRGVRTMTVDQAVLVELANLRSRLPELSGSVLATTDGLVVAHDAHGIEPDSIAALAAAHLALARRFAARRQPRGAAGVRRGVRKRSHHLVHRRPERPAHPGHVRGGEPGPGAPRGTAGGHPPGRRTAPRRTHGQPAAGPRPDVGTVAARAPHPDGHPVHKRPAPPGNGLTRFAHPAPSRFHPRRMPYPTRSPACR